MKRLSRLKKRARPWYRTDFRQKAMLGISWIAVKLLHFAVWVGGVK